MGSRDPFTHPTAGYVEPPPVLSPAAGVTPLFDSGMTEEGEEEEEEPIGGRVGGGAGSRSGSRVNSGRGTSGGRIGTGGGVWKPGLLGGPLSNRSSLGGGSLGAPLGSLGAASGMAEENEEEEEEEEERRVRPTALALEEEKVKGGKRGNTAAVPVKPISRVVKPTKSAPSQQTRNAKSSKDRSPKSAKGRERSASSNNADPDALAKPRRSSSINARSPSAEKKSVAFSMPPAESGSAQKSRQGSCSVAEGQSSQAGEEEVGLNGLGLSGSGLASAMSDNFSPRTDRTDRSHTSQPHDDVDGHKSGWTTNATPRLKKNDEKENGM